MKHLRRGNQYDAFDRRGHHRAKRYIGHNPAGGAMVFALLVAISGIAATGYMMTTDGYRGVE